jgi:N-acetylneuraminate synthase
VVAIRDIKAGEALSKANIWVKRPGTGQIKAEHFDSLLGKKARADIRKNEQIRWDQLVD